MGSHAVARFLTEVGTVSNTAKVSISIPDEGLLEWAKERSVKSGVSLSAVFTEALRFERQMEARRQFLEEMGPAGRPSAEEAAAIRAEWAGGPPVEFEIPTRAMRTASKTAKRAAAKRSKSSTRPSKC